MKKLYWIFLLSLIVITACKKSTDENNDSSWTEEDQAFYDNVITLQDQAAVNYTTWLQTMDSLEVINKLQQFFLDDASVTSATIGGQGIAVQYSNGFRGGVFLDPEDNFQVDSTLIETNPVEPYAISYEKSLVNKKKAIFLNPSYWERSDEANSVIASYNQSLPKVGFAFQNIYKGMSASLDQFTQLSGYGIIHVYSHGWAWPKNNYLSEVYLMTGEKASENITAKYAVDIKKGTIMIAKTKTYVDTYENLYWISEKFVADHNDFSKDTVLFYGGFCYGFMGTWPEISNTFAKGAYFGFTWRVETCWNVFLAKNLISNLSDTTKIPPVNTEQWFVGPAPSKVRWDTKYELFCRLQYTGDATLTLWKSLEIETSPVTNITETNATGGGNVKSDGGLPVTARGLCWSISPNPTIAGDHTTDGSGTGIFTSNLTGLTANKQYNVRAYATNSKGTFYGNVVSFTAGVGETVTDIDGNVYHTVTIGTQVWLVENLRVTRYNDGGAIALITTNANWYENGKIKGPAYCHYNNDPNNSITYGLLYNWYTIAGNVCPTGWHVPTNTEWTTLEEDIIGMVNAGGKMKETGTAHWLSPNTGATNESGFTALPGGHRMWEGTSTQLGEASQWWSSTASDEDNSYFRQIFYDDTWIHGAPTENERGLSIRCIKD